MKIYKTNIIKGLEDLASYHFQKIAWFENDQGLSSSFSEDVEAVFMDTGLEDALDANEIVFGKEVDEALRDLDKTVDGIGYHRDERELINSPEMRIVRVKAAKVLELIKASDGRESTVEIIE
ncbi:MAG: hypothetical protein AABY33_01535 [Pseudomonadota bacterium]